MKWKSLVVVGAALASLSAQAAGWSGMSYALRDNDSSYIGFVRPQDAGSEIRLNLALNLGKASEAASTVFGVGAGVGFRKYLSEVGKVKIYQQPSVAFNVGDFANFGPTFTLGAGYAFGGEYWIAPNFSFGAAGGLFLNLSQEFKAFALTTATSELSVTYYW